MENDLLYYTFDENVTKNYEGMIEQSYNLKNIVHEILVNIGILFFIMIGGFGAAIIVVGFMERGVLGEYNARIGYDKEEKEEEKKEEKEEETEEEFCAKYLNLYKDLEEREIDKDELASLKEQFIEEKTPRGVIMLNYDIDGYTYYCNTTDIPYIFLEAVAQHYVIKYNCKNLLIDTELELEKAQKLKEEKELEEKEREEKEQKEKELVTNVSSSFSVFARFKTYNDTPKNKKTKNKEDIKILPERSNHYKYKGKVEDYEKLFNKDNPEEFEHLDYSTFKKLASDKKCD